MQNKYIHGVGAEEQDRLSLLNELTNQSFFSFLELEDTTKILEIGSGLGIFAEKVAQQYKKSAITGLEYSENQLAKCNKKIKKNNNMFYLKSRIFKKINERFIKS